MESWNNPLVPLLGALYFHHLSFSGKYLLMRDM